MHTISSISFYPHNLDIAQIEINTAGYETYGIPTYAKEVSVGDTVIAIGYPTYADKVLEFSISEGKVNLQKDLLMDDGFAFQSIESDAYTNFGSSGGGLFNKEGDLAGINTWGNVEAQKSIAIKYSSLTEIKSLEACRRNSYLDTDHVCVEYCKREEVLGQDKTCYGVCDNFYCNSKKINGNDERCTDGYIAGDDGYCHPPCGSTTIYCAEKSICFNNNCVSCKSGVLFKDGTCRPYS